MKQEIVSVKNQTYIHIIEPQKPDKEKKKLRSEGRKLSSDYDEVSQVFFSVTHLNKTKILKVPLNSLS